MEDINNVLNAGEVPNIFPVEDKMEICDGVRPFAKSEFGKASDDMNAQVRVMVRVRARVRVRVRVNVKVRVRVRVRVGVRGEGRGQG